MAMLPEPQITRYQRFLRESQHLQFDNYDALWRWSVTDLEAFWRSIWQFFDLQSPTPYARVLGDDRMPGARWFEGAQVNYAQQVLRHVDALQAAGHPAILFADEPMLAQGRIDALSWADLRRQVAACALALRDLGSAVLPQDPGAERPYDGRRTAQRIGRHARAASNPAASAPVSSGRIASGAAASGPAASGPVASAASGPGVSRWART